MASESRFLGSILARETPDGAQPPSMGELGLNHFAPYLMNRIMARWNATMTEALKGFDMTTAQMRALAVLSISSGITINELSVLTVTEQSTMSRTLDAMEEQGLVQRRQRADDLRVREVHLTEAGRAAFDRIWPMMYGKYAQMFEGVSERDYESFVATLHVILRNIRQHEI